MHPRTSRKRLFLGLGILAAILGIAATQELVRRVYAGNPENLVTVGFACREAGVSDGEVGPLVDGAIASLFGAAGLDAILDPGDKVVIKVNLVGPKDGPAGAQGLAIITDPRVVRHVAQRVRDIIGWDAPAELTVVDACFADTPASQDTGNWHGGFYWARHPASPLHVSRSESVRARWQNSIATNCVQHVNPLAPRSAPCRWTKRENSVRGNCSSN